MSLIVIEGLDGSGKGTQSQLLLGALEKTRQVKKITFPDYDSSSSALVKLYLSGAFGNSPEDVNAYAASTFYAVDRFASFKMGWKKDYEAGTTILADRYTTSNIVFQLGKLPREAWEEYISWAEDFEYGKLGLPRPDCVIFLDMPVGISQGLLTRRYEGHEERKDIHERDLQFLEKCGESARFAADRLGWNVISCAARGEALPVEEIHRRVLEVLEKAGA